MYKGPHLIAIVTMLLSACQTTVSNQTSLNATWKYAPVSIPKSMTIDGTTCTGTLASQKIRKCMEKIHPERMYPLVIYMHGCSGLGAPSLGGGNWNTIRTLRSLGYAVIAPDSYARLGRKEECKPKGRKHFTLSLRFAEIRYALAQIQKFDWVDQSRLVLAGVSEGGNTVAEYNGEDAFVGYIVMAWDCRHGLYPTKPVLAIQGANDPIMKGVCHVGSRESSDSIIVPDAGHDVAAYRETKAALETFLSAVAPLE